MNSDHTEKSKARKQYQARCETSLLGPFLINQVSLHNSLHVHLPWWSHSPAPSTHVVHRRPTSAPPAESTSVHAPAATETAAAVSASTPPESSRTSRCTSVHATAAAHASRTTTATFATWKQQVKQDQLQSRRRRFKDTPYGLRF